MNSVDRKLFEVPEQVIYLNTANIGPRLKAVSAAGHQAIERFASPWNISAEAWFSGPEALRTSFADLIGVPPDRIGLVPSASYGIAIAAKNIPVAANDTIVIVEEQYPSNVYAWRRRAGEANASITIAERSAKRSLTQSVLERIDARTALVAIPNCHWTDGELIDLAAVGAAARSVGAALVIDASQSLGAYPIDFATVQPDFVVAVGYKWLLGPYGLGYLYVAEKWHAAGVPLEESWLSRLGSEDFSRLVDYVDDYRPGARRFDFGEFPQFINVPMALAAIEQLSRWGISYIQSELSHRTEQIRAVCERLGLDSLPRDRSADHLVGLRIPNGRRPNEIGSALRSAGIIVSLRGETIRVAPHLHTTANDLDRFGSALEQIRSGGTDSLNKTPCHPAWA